MTTANFQKGLMTLQTKLRDILVEIDQDASDNYLVGLTITQVVQSGSPAAVEVYNSNPTGTLNIQAGVDDAATRTAKGIYTFYGIDSNIVTDAEEWDKSDGGVIQEGMIYEWKWIYTVNGKTYSRTKTRVYGAEVARDAPPQHYYTLGDLKSVVTDFLGADPGSDDVTSIVNDGISLLWNAHPWSFRVGDPALLDTVAGQPYIALPLDFLVERSLERTNDTTHQMVKVTMREMRRLREAATSTPTVLTYFLLSTNPTRDQSGVPRQTLEIYPTPATSASAVFTMDYERVAPALVDDADIAPISLGMWPLVKQAVRAQAALDEGDMDGEKEYGRFAAMLQTYARADDARKDTVHLGRIGDAENLSRGHGYSPGILYPVDPNDTISVAP